MEKLDYKMNVEVSILDISNLKQQIMNGNMEEVIRIIEQIAERKERAYIPTLIDYLIETDHNILRNAIAIALSDLKAQESVEPILNLVLHPKTAKNRGTLLYALEGLDCSSHSLVITRMIVDGNFEVSRQAYQLLFHIHPQLSFNVREQCRKIIVDHHKSNQDDWLKEVLELFD
ncbi:HEAT repeat domain-containing protein [Marinicrinis sediminis]|uniref:HEAT repeat domain-containing protein n=1 Tax=Marinicrinis sediminis TaxID=1652465 RepID=A0ABW5R9V6_9BACL